MSILVAVNHTIGEALIDAAVDCACASHAQVLLLHVLPRANARREASARAHLDTLVACLARRGLRAEPIVRTGDVASVVLEEARRHWVSAIVLGISRRSTMLSAVVGRVSTTIERAASCPVLLVQREPQVAEAPAVWSFSAAAERSGAVIPRLPRFETVDVVRIVGSVGRAHELASDFRPDRRWRRRHDEQRLRRVRDALEAGRALPPLELYKLGWGYYVLDGHHRVAAALMIGQVALDARVVEYVPVQSLN